MKGGKPRRWKARKFLYDLDFPEDFAHFLQVPPAFFNGPGVKEKHRSPNSPCLADHEGSGFSGEMLPTAHVASRGRPGASGRQQLFASTGDLLRPTAFLSAQALSLCTVLSLLIFNSQHIGTPFQLERDQSHLQIYFLGNT